MTKPELTPEEMLEDDIASFYDDPLGYVMYNFPWDSDPVLKMVTLKSPWKEKYNCKHGPDAWACQLLDDWGDEIKDRAFDGVHAVDPIQFSVASGHGIGKTALAAWVVKFIFDTRPYSRGTVTANTDVQLRTKTWAEVGKWHRRSMTAHWADFNIARGNMALRARGEDKDEWFVQAQTCREENSEAFAGQHAPNSTSWYLFDEASGIPDKIYEVREGGMSDGEPMTFDFGNPTKNTGRFKDNMEGRHSKYINCRHIDSRDVEITNPRDIARKKEIYGEDSDYFKVRVRGMFPDQGSMQFIPTNLVEEAMARETTIDRYAPIIMGVDVARHGDDDSVIHTRVGYDARTIPILRKNGLNAVELEDMIIGEHKRLRLLGIPPTVIFVDSTGVGGPVADHLRDKGYHALDVNFGVKGKKGYRYKSDEIYGNLKNSLTKLCLPTRNDEHGQDLYDELTQREFGYTLDGSKIHLEPKKDFKVRIGRSPDIGDALAVTFAQDIPALVIPHGATGVGMGVMDLMGGRQTIHEYDPTEAGDKW